MTTDTSRTSQDKPTNVDNPANADGKGIELDRPATVKGRVRKSDVFRFAGLLAFVVISVVACVLAWPYIQGITTPDGREHLITAIQNAGPGGFLILLGMQFLQIVVAFIPGEIVQIAAGMLYGPWLGGLLLLIGCVVSSAFVFWLVRRLGAPFVQELMPTRQLEKFRRFEESGKLDVVVFILFLIPAMPKDTFTYLVPLTRMPMKKFMILTNVGRIPGILLSTYAADGLVDGRLMESIIIFAVMAVIAVLCVVFRAQIMNTLERAFPHKGK